MDDIKKLLELAGVPMDSEKVQNLLTEFNATQQAKLEMGQDNDDPRVAAEKARMSDQQKLKAREEEIRNQEMSNDPIDKKISQLRKQIAQLEQQKLKDQAAL